LFPRSVVPSFRRSRLLSTQKNQKKSKSKNSFKNGFTLFYGGRVPKYTCDIFQKKKKIFVPAFCRPKKNSESRQGKKFDFFLFKTEKNSSIFELPDPEIGGLGHFGSG
jgi:hypothetical protein